MTRSIFDSSAFAAYTVMIFTSLCQTALMQCAFSSRFTSFLPLGAYQVVTHLQPVPHKQTSNLRSSPKFIFWTFAEKGVS